MSDFTPRANLRLPGGGSTGTILPDEQVDIDVLNDNFRKIDALLGARNIPSASSYAGSMDGDLVYARDTEYLHMFSANAGGLITPRLPGARQYSGTATERVAFAPQAKDGDLWRDTDNIGVIWAYKAGSPGTWEYTGNMLRGTRAAMDQLVTDGRAVEGMTVFNTTDNSEYVRSGGQWTRPAGSRIAYAEASTTAPVNSLDMPVTTPPLAAGQRVRVKTSPIGGSSAGVTPLPYFLRHTTNGSAVTAASPELAMGRFLPASGGNVVSAVPLEVEFTMPAAGVLKVALNPAFAVYSDPRWLAIYTAQ